MDGFDTTGQVRISDPQDPFTSDMTVFTSEVTVFTSGLLTLASGTTAPTPVTRYSFTDTSGTITEPERNTESQQTTLSPSIARSFSADPVITSTMSRHQSSSLSTTGTCHQLTPNRLCDILSGVPQCSTQSPTDPKKSLLLLSLLLLLGIQCGPLLNGIMGDGKSHDGKQWGRGSGRWMQRREGLAKGTQNGRGAVNRA